MRKDVGIQGLGDLVVLPIVATLATYRRDGRVLLSPVWHEWHDGGFQVVIDADDVKARHVGRDPTASLALYESEPPYRGLEIRANAILTADGVADALRRIAVRYLGRTAGEAYASDPGASVILRLEPGVLRTWDFADERWA